MNTPAAAPPLRFGEYELDVSAGELRRQGQRLKLQPQPFRLLVLLAGRAGALVTRDEIRRELWPEGTFVDFDQAVNFAIKQIRDALRDAADRPLYIETVPRRGYRFIAPVDAATPVIAPSRAPQVGTTTIRLQKVLWANIAELRMAEVRRRKYMRIAGIIGVVLLVSVTLFLIASR